MADLHLPRPGTGATVDSDRHSSESDLPSQFHQHRVSSLNSRFNISAKKRAYRRRRKSTLELQQWDGWELNGRGPYHEYVHKLVESGWSNLTDLDEYMNSDFEDENLTISVVDLTDDNELRHHEDLHDDVHLKNFLERTGYSGVRCRLYLAEQKGTLASSVMEALGAGLKLDPRWLQWHIKGSKNVMSSAARHRAPYTALTFRIIDPDSDFPTDTQSFRVSLYVQPHQNGHSWTGIVLFNSHLQTEFSCKVLMDPPPFGTRDSDFPPPFPKQPRTFRELYLDMLPSLDIGEAGASPFYAFSPLFRLNCNCWTRLIYVIREEDQKLGAISEVFPVALVEEVRKCSDVVQRGGSLGWMQSSSAFEEEMKTMLQEDFAHSLKQAQFLWDNREKMAKAHERRSKSRISALTNAFTFIFVPISLVSSIYGMNVWQITGDDTNPNIWQFFVATIGLNVVILTILALSSWIQIISRQKRWAGFREVLEVTLGTQRDLSRRISRAWKDNTASYIKNGHGRRS